MHTLSAIFIASTLIVTANAHASNDLEISGIRVGMVASDAKKTIASVNARYKFMQINHPNGGSLGVSAIAMKSAVEVADNFQALNDESGKVWFIGRAQVIEPGNRFSKDQLLDSLVQKYGQPSFSGNGYAKWHRDRSGNLFKGDAINSPCNIFGSKTKENQQFGLSVIATPVTVPATFNPECGSVIDVIYLADAQGGLVNKWSIRAYDSASVSDALNRESAANQQKQDAAINAEKSANNKPKL